MLKCKAVALNFYQNLMIKSGIIYLKAKLLLLSPKFYYEKDALILPKSKAIGLYFAPKSKDQKSVKKESKYWQKVRLYAFTFYITFLHPRLYLFCSVEIVVEYREISIS